MKIYWIIQDQQNLQLIFLETKDKKKFLVILDFFQTIPIGEMMKYVSFLWRLEEEYQIKTIHTLPAFHKNMIVWVGETNNQELLEDQNKKLIIMTQFKNCSERMFSFKRIFITFSTILLSYIR